MNTIYRIVWNAATGKWIVASELAKGRKKKSAAKVAVLALALAGLSAPVAFAADTDSQDQTEKVDEGKSDTITPFYAIGGGDDGGRADNVAIGSSAATLSQNSVAIGSNAIANNVANVAIGWGANTTGSNAVSLGYNATANGNYAISLGGGSTASAGRATALGTDTVASGANSTALGNAAKSQGSLSVAVGNSTATSTAANSAVAIGSNASVTDTGTNSVALGHASVADRANTISVGAFGSERQIVNVAAGTADTDAANVAQLKGTAESVADIIGGGATVGADGTITAPSYSVGGTTVNNVGDAISNIDGRVTKNTGDIVTVQNNLTAATRYFKASGKNDGTDDAVAGTNSVAAGPSASARGNGAVAVGSGAAANYNNAIAIGAGASITGSTGGYDGRTSLAIGGNATAAGQNTVVLGYGASANSLNASGTAGSTAIGANATANAWNATALGYGAAASNDVTTAIGRSSAASGARSTAIGGNSSATASYGVALGYGSTATRANSVAVGNATLQRQITFVAAGTQNTDAVNVSQLQSVVAGLGGGASINPTTGAVTGPTYSVGGTDVYNAGDAISNIDSRVIQNAGDIVNVQNDLTAATRYFKADGLNDGSDDALASGWLSVGMGPGSAATSARSIAIGSGAQATTNEGTIAIGANSRATGENSVALGYGSEADRDNVVSIGWGMGGNGTRQLINVANGTENADAVNVQQLKPLISALGGGAAMNGSGVVTGPQYTVADLDNGGDKTVDNVGDALGQLNANTVQLDGRVTKNEGDIVTIGDRVSSAETNITNLDGRVTKNESSIVDIRNELGSGSLGLVQQDATSRDITVAAGTDGGRVNFAGTDGARKLAGVADGELSSTSDEAVNGSQLFATNERVTKNEGDIVTIGDRVSSAETNITNLDGRVTKNESSIVDIRNELGSGSLGLVQQDATSRDIAVAAGTDGGRVNFTGTDGARKLAGVADGELSATSDEAVNGSQLFATNERVTKNEGDIVTIGDRVSSAETNITNLDGRVTQNEGDIVTIGNRVTSNETNITNLDGRVTKNEGDIVNLGDRISNGSVGLVQQAGASAAITVAAATGGGIVDFTGTDGTRQLKGVSEGSDGTDAVNVSQLRNELAKASAGDTRYFKADGVNDGSDDAVNTGSRSVAIGAGSQATADNAVALGAGSVADRANAVSVGSAGNERQIVNVADGTEDTDAVNVRQLKSSGLIGDDGSLMDAVVYDAGSSRGSITLGGVAGTTITNVMAGLVAPGSMDAINGGQLWGVQDQINKLGDRVTTIENGSGGGTSPADPLQPSDGNPHFASSGDAGKPATATGGSSVAAGEGAAAVGNNSTAIGAGASVTGNNSVAIGAGSVADADNTVSVGSAGNERRITNVAAGTQRTDAANVGQLQDAMSNLQDWTQGQVNGLSKKVDNVQRQANRGIAASAALVNNMPYLPGKVTLNAGVAAYRGQSALGVGVSRWNDSGRFNVNAGISAAQGDAPIFRVGVGVVLGD
ncbi:ESPR-type extended signal peptide-containing protein [Dyella sp. GSA-30]|uniref:ESPR-type extended signal peptide-containing protein n=1 Tax=Dyella sp. GSA-30 TaxID=2994496 RepID=UPI002490B893|nr:ESPR-type extended signal peptide-containing protein [Dyella sp. GSA-30]BDU18772.1 collagen-binding protein [Dyella sp. GSA-30]